MSYFLPDFQVLEALLVRLFALADLEENKDK